jgi:hypothetical protein
MHASYSVQFVLVSIIGLVGCGTLKTSGERASSRGQALTSEIHLGTPTPFSVQTEEQVFQDGNGGEVDRYSFATVHLPIAAERAFVFHWVLTLQPNSECGEILDRGFSYQADGTNKVIGLGTAAIQPSLTSPPAFQAGRTVIFQNVSSAKPCTVAGTMEIIEGPFEVKE